MRGRAAIVVVTLVALTLAACGDAGSAAAAGAFCDDLAELFRTPLRGDANRAALRDLAEDAPEELAGSIAVLVDAGERSAAGDTEDTPEQLQAASDVLAYLRIDCGVDPNPGPFRTGSYAAKFEGVPSGGQAGGAGCELAKDPVVGFSPDVLPRYRYRLSMGSLERGDATVTAHFELTDTDTGAMSSGPATVELRAEFGDRIRAEATFDGTYDGPAGSGTVSSRFSCEVEEIAE